MKRAGFLSRAVQSHQTHPLSYATEISHIERILVAVKNMDRLFRIDSEIFESGKLNLFLLSGVTRIDDNKHLESLETATELTVRTEEQIQKLLIFFDIKRNLHFQKMPYPLNIDYFI